MKSSDAPSKQSVPFGVNGSRQSILETTPTGSNAASYDVGFPPITMILKSAGGLPPLGQNWNQILYELSGISRFLSAGGGYVYDSAFSTAVGGYPAGAVIPNSTLNGLWINTVDDNTTNPENSTAALTGWVPAFSYGTTSFTGLTSASVTVGTLDASKDVITLTGLLTANINLVLPAWVKKWDIVNNTTGAFTVTVKTPSGNGVAIQSGFKVPVIGDGTNISTNYPPGSLIRPPISITSSGSYTPPPGTKTIVVEAIGGGGGGGSTAATNSSQVSIASGGSAGSLAKAKLNVSDFTSPVSVVIGTAGNGGAASSNSGGSAGSATYFGSLITAPGGPGGAASSAVSSSSPAANAPTARGNVSTGGNLVNSAGEGGGAGFFCGSALSGAGGSTIYGSGGSAAQNAAGNIGTGYGSGGGGAAALLSVAARSGGNGAPGVIMIWEYS